MIRLLIISSFVISMSLCAQGGDHHGDEVLHPSARSQNDSYSYTYQRILMLEAKVNQLEAELHREKIKNLKKQLQQEIKKYNALLKKYRATAPYIGKKKKEVSELKSALANSKKVMLSLNQKIGKLENTIFPNSTPIIHQYIPSKFHKDGPGNS